MSEEKKKKPFYKKWWVWVIAIIIVFAAVGAGGDDETTSETKEKSDNASSEETNNSNENEENEESGPLSIGDTAEFKGAKFTLKSVEKTDERNEFADTDPTEVIVIEYELENTGEDDLPYGAEITVYDADGNKMESYPLDNSLGALAPGKKLQGTEAHGIDAVGTIEIHYAPLISLEDAAVFEVEID